MFKRLGSLFSRISLTRNFLNNLYKIKNGRDEPMSNFTHFNKQGRARMVDISEKGITERTAMARTSVHVTKDIYKKIVDSDVEKGDVLGVAQVAGIMAAKNTDRKSTRLNS